MVDLHRHSLDVILANQTPQGAYIACPVMPDYQFSWFRDGAYIAYALTVDGGRGGIQTEGSMAAQWDSAGRFHDWAAGIILSRADALERTIARASTGEPLDLADTLNARYLPDGSVGPADWPEFQLDGPGTWLWSLEQYVNMLGMTPLPYLYEDAIRLTARYLAAVWAHPCHDCWEELPNDVHLNTVGSIYTGLQAANRMLPDLKLDATLAAMKAYVLEKGLTPGGELAKSVGRDMVDANLLALAVPDGMFPPNDPLMRRTIERIERDLHAPKSGVHRHVEDVYYGGGAWVLLALWLAWYYAEAGEPDKALELFRWSEAQADAEGNLPEQVNTFMLAPAHYEPWVKMRGEIANPLLWTHAEYLIVRDRLLRAGMVL
jgi:GH15 family glucan-1,4-alpha-glucosidase